MEFQRDMLLMFQNAFMYNSSDHDVFFMAQSMKADVMENIQVSSSIQLSSSHDLFTNVMLCCVLGLPGDTGPAAADGRGTTPSENTQEQGR